jgi:hypothetical protein
VSKVLGEETLRDSSKTPEQAAFKYFNLTETATWEEVNAIFRARSKTAHPDKGGTTSEMAQASQHLMTLKRHFERKVP